MNDIVTTVIAKASDYDLTDLGTVKSELSITGTDSDDFLARGISQVSAAIANACNRVFPVETISDLFFLGRNCRFQVDDCRLQLSRFPILSITSIIEDAGLSTQTTLVQGTDFLVDSDIGQIIRIDASQGVRRRWTSKTLTALYDAGYGVLAVEAKAIPATGTYTVDVSEKGLYDLDKGVKFVADGAALVPVAASPAAGQYSVAAGTYTFNAADASKAINISYVWADIPDDVVEASLRLVTTRFKQKDRDPMLVQLDQPQIGSKRWWVGTTPGQTGPFPPEIQGLLDNGYYMPTIA